MKLTIELLSDLCVGTGELSGGAVDHASAADEYGIPVIPGKRIKGLFREAAEELADHGIIPAEKVNELFGTPGGAETGIHFGTLYPQGYQEVRSFIEAIGKSRNGWATYSKYEWVQSFYTSVRTQTALNTDGAADENTLRSRRVVCQKYKEENIYKNRKFEGIVEIPETMDKEPLIWCAKMIRHIGSNRTRGYGNIRCCLEDGLVDDKREKANIVRPAELESGEGALGVQLTLEQPCVMDEDFISGRRLMGAFVSAFLRKERSMGKDISDIHENERFQALFLSGEVQYGFCWPYKNGRIHEPLPKSFLKERHSESAKLYDLAACEQEDMLTFINEKEKADQLFAAFGGKDEKTLYFVDVERNTMNHHRRPEDRAVGHAVGKNGKGDRNTGQLYSFSLMKEGQEFFGEIRGDKGLLEELQKLTEHGERLYLGAGRTAEYGRVRVDFKEVPCSDGYEEPEERTVITLRSPMIAEDSCGNPSAAAGDIFRAIFPEKPFSETEVFSFFEEQSYGGYQAKWGMPLPQRMAAVPGSVLVIYGMELSEKEAEELENHSYGRYTEEGYGRISVNRHGEHEIWSLIKEQENPKAAWPELNKGNVSILEACIKDRVYQTCRGIECMKKVEKHLKKVPNANVLAGVIQMVRISESFEELKQQLKQAAERTSKVNGTWCKTLAGTLFGTELTENYFLVQSIAEIKNSELQELPASWQVGERWRAMLNGDSGFLIFREILGQKLYEIHLEKGRRE